MLLNPLTQVYPKKMIGAFFRTGFLIWTSRQASAGGESAQRIKYIINTANVLDDTHIQEYFETWRYRYRLVPYMVHILYMRSQ